MAVVPRSHWNPRDRFLPQQRTSKLLRPAERAAELMTRIVLKVSFTEGTVGHFTWFGTSAVTRSKFILCIVFFLSFCVGIAWFAEIILSSQQEQRCPVAVLHEVIQNGFGAPVKKQRYYFNALLLILLFYVKLFLFYDRLYRSGGISFFLLLCASSVGWYQDSS